MFYPETSVPNIFLQNITYLRKTNEVIFTNIGSWNLCSMTACALCIYCSSFNPLVMNLSIGVKNSQFWFWKLYFLWKKDCFRWEEGEPISILKRLQSIVWKVYKWFLVVLKPATLDKLLRNYICCELGFCGAFQNNGYIIDAFVGYLLLEFSAK